MDDYKMFYEGISVIIPVYNASKYLDKCISSVINQTYDKIEIILVNDGSTDNSFDICRKYQKLDSRIKIIDQSNMGQNAARKTGLMNAKYNLIGFVDSDDWINSNMYEALINMMQEYNCDLVSSGIIHDYEDGRTSEELIDHYEEGFYDNLDDDIYPIMLWDKDTSEFGLYCNLVNKIFKKDLLEEVFKEIDTRVYYGEDALVFYSYMMKSKSVYINKSSYYHYWIHSGSMCGCADERLVMNAFYLYKGLEKAFINSEKSCYDLLKQLKNYVLQLEAHMLYQLYGINTNRLNAQEDLYKKVMNKRIVLYGAGGYGRVIYQYLHKNVECEVVAWVDKAPEGKDLLCCHKIVLPELIKEVEYDCVLIAVKEAVVAKNIRCELMAKYQIPKNLILWNETFIESIFEDVYLT